MTFNVSNREDFDQVLSKVCDVLNTRTRVAWKLNEAGHIEATNLLQNQSLSIYPTYVVMGDRRWVLTLNYFDWWNLKGRSFPNDNLDELIQGLEETLEQYDLEPIFKQIQMDI